MFYKPGQAKPIPLLDFAPDRGSDYPGIILDAYRARPTTSGFRPQNGLTVAGDALVGRPLGAVQPYYSSETRELIAAVTDVGAAEFYAYSGTTPVAIGTASIATPGRVQFTQFGDAVVAAGGFASGLYRRVNGSGNFVVIAGSPANASVVLAIGAQVLAFSGTNWFSSAAGDETDWALSSATLAATGTLYDSPGPVVATGRIVRNIIAFKKGTVHLGELIGLPGVWGFHPICTETGTWSQGCVVQLPSGVAFLGLDDFWITSGYTPERIPNFCKEWFWRTVNGAYIEFTRGWYDVPTSTIYWHFVSNDAPDPPTCDMFVSYNTAAHRWCVGHQDVSATPHLGIAARGVPTPIPANAPIFFDGLFTPQQFSAAPGGMSLTTGYYGDRSRLSHLIRVAPVFQSSPGDTVFPAAQSLTPLHVDELGKPDQSTEPAIYEPKTGFFCGGSYNRYHRWIHSVTGDCEVAAYTPDFRSGGTA